MVDKERMLIDSTGLLAPNLTQPKDLKAWIEWDGDYDSLPRLKTRLWTAKSLGVESANEL